MPCPRSMPIALGGPDGAARRRVRMAESSVGQPYKSPRRPDPSSKPPLPAMCDRVVLSSPLDRCAYLAKRHRIRTRQSQCGTREKCRLFHILVRWKGDSRPRSSRRRRKPGRSRDASASSRIVAGFSRSGWPTRIRRIGSAPRRSAPGGPMPRACSREHCRPQPDRAGRRAVAPVRIDVVESSARSNNPASILPSEEAVGHALAS